jgi:hypothetical protein
MQARIQPVIDAEQGKSAPPGNIIDLKPVLEMGEEHDTAAPDAARGEGKRPSRRDRARLCRFLRSSVSCSRSRPPAHC